MSIPASVSPACGRLLAGFSPADAEVVSASDSPQGLTLVLINPTTEHTSQEIIDCSGGPFRFSPPFVGSAQPFLAYRNASDIKSVPSESGRKIRRTAGVQDASRGRLLHQFRQALDCGCPSCPPAALSRRLSPTDSFNDTDRK